MSIRLNRFKPFLFHSLLMIAFSSVFAASEKQQVSENELGISPLVASGPDFELRLSDIDKRIDPELDELLQRLHKERLRVLRATVVDYVSRKEAEALGVSRKELWQQWKDSAPAVTDNDIEAFVSENRAELPERMLNNDKRIRSFLENQRRSKMQEKTIYDLLEKYDIKVGISEPVIRRYQLDELVRLNKGEPGAPVHIVEFSDFECPYCRRAQNTFKRLEQEYGNKLRFSFKHFPLPSHRGAVYTAMATECANDQGKFWLFKEAIFNTATPGERETILQTATQLDLDMKVFDKCFTEEKHRTLVEKDKRDGEQLGVVATPTVFVNGIKMRGAGYKNLKATVDKEINRNIALNYTKKKR